MVTTDTTSPSPSVWDEVIRAAVPQTRLSIYGSLSKISKAEITPPSDDPDEPRTDLPELVLAGYCSPQIVDQQQHLITKEAMARDLPRFLAVPEYRNSNLLHTNIQAGVVLPNWRDPTTNELYTTKVDDIGLFGIVKIRTDRYRPPVQDEIVRDVLNGKLAAFSISADAPFNARKQTCQNGACFTIIDRIYFYEWTLCSKPVNQKALASILTKALPTIEDEYAAYALCSDGSCYLPSYTSTALMKALTPSLDDDLRAKYLTMTQPSPPLSMPTHLTSALWRPQT